MATRKLFGLIASLALSLAIGVPVAPVAVQAQSVLTLSQFAVDRTVTPWRIYHRANNGAIGLFATQDPTTGAITFAVDAASIVSGTISGARLPGPTLSSKGAVLVPTVAANAFLTGIANDGSGAFTSRQVNFADLVGQLTLSQIPNYLITYTQEAQALPHTLAGNPTGFSAVKQDATLQAYLDDAFGNAQGTIAPCRGASNWGSPSNSAAGTVYTSLGPGQCPTFQSAPSALPSLPKRQTVLTGPSYAAAPSFIPVSNRDLLLHLDGANGATTTSDSGSGNSAPHTITFGGSAALSTAQTKFGASSAFDGASATGNYVRVANAADITVGTNDFTIEFWTYPTASNASSTAAQSLLGNRAAAGATVWEIGFCNTAQGATGTSICWFNQTAGTAALVGGSVSLNAWHHVAVVRQSTFLTIYIDGVATNVPVTDLATYSSTNPIQLFGNLNAGVLGYIDEVSITNGYARYSSQVPTGFTPPSSAYTAGGLGLSFQNISTGVPLVATAAQGTNVNGAVNNIYKWDTVPPNCGTLPANSTVYLALNAQSGACVQLSLVPIYQFGGQISASPGQFTFDKQANVAYLAGTATPLVMAGEVTTNASAVTSASPYAYNGVADTGWIAGLPVGVTSRATNLGSPNGNARWIVEGTAADAGCGSAAGDQLNFQTVAGSYYVPPGIFLTRNQILLSVGASFGCYTKSATFTNPTSGANFRHKLVVQQDF